MIKLSNISIPCSLGIHKWGAWQSLQTVRIPHRVGNESRSGHTISHRRSRFCDNCYSKQEGETSNKVQTPSDPDQVAWKPVAMRRGSGAEKLLVARRATSDL